MRKIRSALTACSAAIILFGCSEDPSPGEKLTQAVHQAKQGNWEAAERTAAELSEKSPKSIAPMLLAALAYERKGDLDKALDLARQCALSENDDFAAQYTFGRLSAKNPLRYSEAFAILERALTLKPGDTDTLVLLCNLGTQLKHPDTGKYLAQLQNDPEISKSAHFFYQLGLNQAEKKNGRAAVEYLWRAVRLGGPRNPELILNAARCIDNGGFSPKDAISLYQFYINHPAKKETAKLQEATARVRELRSGK